MRLPETYQKKMQDLLEDSYPDYIESFQQEPTYGLRVNTLKISVEEFQKISPFSLRPIPWTKNGFYVNADQNPAKHPYYYAGLYYLQEPSAMLPAQTLPIEPGDIVLDTCAAPGGKSTELACRLAGQGLLVANDISASRAQALLKNMEVFGVENAIVCSEDILELAKKVPACFDKILIDAPCSGEGMFRKDSSLVKNWIKKNASFYAPIQAEILEAAFTLLRPGGKIVYSTCTFDPQEDEAVLLDALKEHSDLHTLSIEKYPGFQEGIGLKDCVRLYPHKVEGEGHFVSLLEKEGKDHPDHSPVQRESTPPKEAQNFLQNIHRSWKDGLFLKKGDKLLFVRWDPNPWKGLRTLRSGLLIGECKKNRFEPSQALACALKKEEFSQTIDLSSQDPRLIKYLKGETIDVSDQNQSYKDWVLLCVDGYSLGFGKISNGIIKNKFKKGWRWQ